MLDQETKRKIDSARDILVGKVPDPKAQVEQITTALIYKFMDDMDKEAEELGGKARFFTKEYAQYTWTKLMSKQLSGQERINLYVEAITKMSQNPNIPQLFRDIFKDAFLPYRDTETLNLFVKEINGFIYDHSERLGDAFEYLLSVLSSQGDAGQFRTPRHIIDFIVDVIEPQKDQTVLDPACGTAGFLISAYKHILKQNTEKRPGDMLTPDQKKKLVNHFVGYDISPDMVRLSLVNMYLHGFANPNIHEYDTLTSEDRWDETYDVILANPPFMTPKGGIRPHKRFSIQANRSEVLFVDYITEHLNVNGKAGVIVPEGIIFQNANAYKALRKMLVEEGYLYAVVSLPVGIFNPYSGVKTSILLMDKSLAKRSQNILFVRVENDGFDLGAQRRAIDKNDLVKADEIIKKYKQAIIKGKSADLSGDVLAHIVSKEAIAGDGDYNFTGERYRKTVIGSTKWPIVKLGSVCDFQGGSQPPKSEFIYAPKKGYVAFIQIRDFGESGVDTYIPESSRNKTCQVDDILIARYGASLGRICTGLEGAYNVALLKTIPDISKLSKGFLFYLLNSDYIQCKIHQLGDRAAQAGVRPDDLKAIKIPLPSPGDQKRIVAEFDNYQKVIDGARQVVENYKPQIKIDSGWEIVKLGKVCKYEGGTQPPKSTFIYEPRKGYIRLLQIRDYKSDKDAAYIPITERHKKCSEEDIMIGRYGPPVFQILKGKSGAYNVALIKCLPDKQRLSNDWLYYFLKSGPIQEHIIGLSTRVRQSGVRPDDLDELDIPLPSLEIQQKIAAELVEEQKIIDENKKLIEIFEGKIKDTIKKVWGE